MIEFMIVINYSDSKHQITYLLNMHLFIYFSFIVKSCVALQTSNLEPMSKEFTSEIPDPSGFNQIESKLDKSNPISHLENVQRSSNDCCTSDHTCKWGEKCSDCNSCVNRWNFKELARCKYYYGFGAMIPPQCGSGSGRKFRCDLLSDICFKCLDKVNRFCEKINRYCFPRCFGNLVG